MKLTEEQNRDVDMMRDPDRWTHWPILPVKRTDPRAVRSPSGRREIGVMGDGAGPTVMLRNLFASPRQIKEAKKMEYLNFTELVQDGGRVD